MHVHVNEVLLGETAKNMFWSHLTVRADRFFTYRLWDCPVVRLTFFFFVALTFFSPCFFSSISFVLSNQGANGASNANYSAQNPDEGFPKDSQTCPWRGEHGALVVVALGHIPMSLKRLSKTRWVRSVITSVGKGQVFVRLFIYFFPTFDRCVCVC